MQFEFPESLTEKYRPRRVEDFAGLKRVKAVVKSFLRKPRSIAFLFLGPSGRGKTTMALAIAEALGAELHHIPSKACDLEEIQRVTGICRYAPFNFKTGASCGWHVILIDEAHKITNAAQLALLSKTDATAFPPQTIFILTATDTDLLEKAFLSRFHVLHFDAEGMDDELPDYLCKIARAEGLKYKINFDHLAKEVDFNLRDAVSKLELELMGSGYLKQAQKERRST